MTEFVERMNLDELVFDDDENQPAYHDPFTPAKMLGVAMLGALGALSVYYVYNQLEPEKRSAVRDGVVRFARNQVKSLTDGGQE